MRCINKLFGALSGFVLLFVFANHAIAASASLSPASLTLSAGQTGTIRLSGDDSRSRKTFQWSYDSGLTVAKGSSSNLDSYSISTSNRTIYIRTNGRGSFSADIKFSANSDGVYDVTNTRADISLNPADMTITVGGAIPVLDATNVSLMVRAINKTMSDGRNVTFWVFCENGMGGGCTLPSPTLEMEYNQRANINLNMMMAPQEQPPYHGHTIHPHGVDVPQSEDGVPETGAPVLGDTYTFNVDSRYVGSHMYHCHVHTVKHLEMGMYGALIVKNGNRISNSGPTYDYEWNWVLSTVDPAYHTAVQDDPVFADYNPSYFLVNGEEGRSTSAPAQTFTAVPGAKVAIRLIGIHSVNSTFQIRNASGSNQSFTVHNVDGFALPSPKNDSSVEVSPGQTKDIMVTLPTSSGTWYPQVSYRNLRNNGTYSNGTVYTRLDF